MPSFSYPRAGRKAPRGVQAEIEQWKLYPDISALTDKTQVPLLYYLLGSGTSPYKMGKEDAAYQEKPVHKQSCKACSSSYQQVVTGDVVCSQVEGKISLSSWCRLFNLDRS